MRIWIVSLMLLALTGCASSVVTDYDQDAVFGNYSSWAFADTAGEKQPLSLDSARVEGAIERAMNRKALRKTPSDEADLLVDYGIEDVERIERTGFSYGLGLGRGPFGLGVATAPPAREIKEGKLVVQLIDSETDRVVWRAASQRHLNEDQSPETRRKLIEEVVSEMFSRYPPGV
ncbi:DUF4136 domain-containing protein [Marinobacter sp.]|uniref:DUF4136 domain-containing protein n=1 Tax=Marinobacter sp. TaxID=50741 RepID=UPI00384C8628